MSENIPSSPFSTDEEKHTDLVQQLLAITGDATAIYNDLMQLLTPSSDDDEYTIELKHQLTLLTDIYVAPLKEKITAKSGKIFAQLVEEQLSK